MKTIYVKQQDSYEQPVTVRVFSDGDLVYCNHANADVEVIEDDGNFEDETVLFCDKCDHNETLWRGWYER